MGFLYAIIAALLFAVSQAAGKAAMLRLSLPATLACRALAGLVFSLFFLGVPLRWPSGNMDFALLILSILLIPIAVNVCYFVGLKKGSLGNQVALFQSVPVFTLITVSLLKLQFPGITSIGAALMILMGCGILSKNSKGGKLSWTMGLLSAVIAGVAIVVQNHVLTSMSREALILTQNSTFFVLAVSATWIIPSPALSEEPKEDEAEVSKTLLYQSKRIWTGVLLAAFSGALMLVGFDWLKYLTLETLGPVITASLLLIRLPFAQILGYLAFRDCPTRYEIIGGLIVISGALCLSLQGD